MKIFLLLALGVVVAESTSRACRFKQPYRVIPDYDAERSHPPWVVALMFVGQPPVFNKFKENIFGASVDRETDACRTIATPEHFCSGTLISWTFVISGDSFYQKSGPEFLKIFKYFYAIEIDFIVIF